MFYNKEVGVRALDWEKDWYNSIYNDWKVVSIKIFEGDYSYAARTATIVFEGILKNVLRKYQTELPSDVQLNYLNTLQPKGSKLMLGELIGFWKEHKVIALLAEKLSKDRRIVGGINMGYIGELRNGLSHNPPVEVSYEEAKYCINSIELLLDFFNLKHFNLTKALYKQIGSVKKEAVKGKESLKSYPSRRVTYYKVLNLRQKDSGLSPIYSKYISRLEKEIEVYDEVFSFGFNQYSSLQDTVKSVVRSSGVVEKNFLMPFQKELVFDDRDERYIENYLQQVIRQKHITSLTSGTIYNGLQPKHQDLAFKMDRDMESAVLIVDFSSLPNNEGLFKSEPEAFLCLNGGEKMLSVGKLAHQVYFLEESDVKEGAVLRMDFDFDWQTRK